MNPELRVSTPSTASTLSALSVWARWFCSFDNRYLAPMLITCILAAGQLSFGILESYTRTLLAILTAIGTELVLARLYRGQWPHLASAYITGISVGILVRSPAFWPYALCSMLSITSKYVLQVKGRHLWNPSNFGLCVMLFLAADVVAGLSIQWGNYLPPMLIVWLLGSLILWQLKRLHISATYVVAFLLFAGMRSWITGQPFLAEVAPDYRAHVSALYLFHDYRPEDHCADDLGAIWRGLSRGPARDGAAFVRKCPCAILCAVSGGAERQPARHLVAGTAICHRRRAMPVRRRVRR